MAEQREESPYLTAHCHLSTTSLSLLHSSLSLSLSLSLQKQSQVSLGGQGMRRELLGPEELYTSEDQVQTLQFSCLHSLDSAVHE